MSVRWWGKRGEWGVIYGTKEAEITAVKMLDAYGREVTRLEMGDKFIVKAEFVVREKVREPHFGVAIFRDDGVYCYGPNTHFDGYRIEELNHRGKGWFNIEYERMLLMPGKYRLSVGIWDKKEILPYSLHIAYYSFRIIGSNKNKQLLFLSYKWNEKESVDSFPAEALIPTDFNSLGEGRQRNFSTKNSNTDIGIDSVRLLDSRGNAKATFNTNEMMKIRIKIRSRLLYDYFIWVGIYRTDGVYCHGASRNLAKGEKIVSLIYPQLPLLTGEYCLSVRIWKKNQREPLLYEHKASVFKMSFERDDHGTVYLEHSWKWQIP